MNQQWRFGDLEFLVLAERLGHDYLPKPFTFMSRTPLHDDYVREKREMVQQVSSRLHADGSLNRVLESLVQPDIRIVIEGWDGRDPKRADKRIRMMAARRGGHGVLVTQLPGETYMHSGGFTLTECDPIMLADGIVAELPMGEPAGDAELPLTPPDEKRDDVDYGYGHSPIGAPVEDDLGRMTQRFLRTPVSLVGTINVIQGTSVYGPRGITEHRLEWRDLEGQGRYAIGHAPPWKAVPADARRLTSMINARIAEVIRVIKEERG
ncbi:ESX secretion-associated protein EspG [Nocardia niigatensis]|uniref:ESX secretion-associated protein EspG n=1 Tax=Nocardia niigatensis TaxID=209249 RepID=UPI0002E135DD|nr:ESX secretion-associated protein EspG [Nocardia niigatensis]